MTKIGIILGSTRPGRNGEAVARWAHEVASQRTDAEFELVDLLDYKLPHLDEVIRRPWASTPQPHTLAVGRQDRLLRRLRDGDPGVQPLHVRRLKNAIDFLYGEWNNKAVGFVSYGAVGGTRAVEHLRLIAGELQMADVRAQVALSLFTDFENFSVFKPADFQPRRCTPRSTRSWPGAPPSRRCAPARRPRKSRTGTGSFHRPSTPPVGHRLVAVGDGEACPKTRKEAPSRPARASSTSHPRAADHRRHAGVRLSGINPPGPR